MDRLHEDSQPPDSGELTVDSTDHGKQADPENEPLSEPDNFNWQDSFRRRSYLMMLFFAVWAMIILFRLTQIMIFDRDTYLTRYESPSWRVGSLPVLRGRILDRQGYPLAWSERIFALQYSVPTDPGKLEADAALLMKAIGLPTDVFYSRIGKVAGSVFLVADVLEPSQVKEINDLNSSRMQVISYSRRRHANGLSSSIRRQIGETRILNQQEVGVTGWEREYDSQLRGKNSEFRVQVDKNGNWIPETWQEVVPPRPGNDVKVPVSLY